MLTLDSRMFEMRFEIYFPGKDINCQSSIAENHAVASHFCLQILGLDGLN